MGAGIVFIGLAVIFRLAMAIPTSLIASQVGQPKWISYAAWCPFTVGWILAGLVLVFPQAANNNIPNAANFFFWVPASVYLSTGLEIGKAKSFKLRHSRRQGSVPVENPA